MKVNTTQLLNDLCQAKDIKAFLAEKDGEFLSVSLCELLNELAARYDMSVAEVARRSGQGEYVYKVFQGKRNPSRDILFAVAVGMGLTLAETQMLLRVAKLAAPDPRDKRDSVMIYAINEKLGVDALNELLYELQEKTL